MKGVGVHFEQRAKAAARMPNMLDAVQRTVIRKQQARLEAWSQLGNVEALRGLAAEIKRHTLKHLSEYVDQFVGRLRDRGAVVHFARTHEEASSIIRQIAVDSHVKLCAHAKSMTGEEIHLRRTLEDAGVRAVETDLGEFVAQISGEAPSHIVAPIIHMDRARIARVLHRETGCSDSADPGQLTAAAREHLRRAFRKCDMGVSGVNFAVAETGSLCICTNEGNGRFVTSRPRVHVALMGIEKIIPRMRDLAVFLKLLARSSTGQPLTAYTSLLTGPRRSGEPDGPEQMHVVMMDAGRSSILRSEFADALACIRCGACLNVCPVYRHAGGHAYRSTYPGPIGQIISPLLGLGEACDELPHASSLCGSCLEACPMKIDIPAMLVAHRRAQVESHKLGMLRSLQYRLIFSVMQSPSTYKLGQKILRLILRGRWSNGWVSKLPGLGSGWTETRDLPAIPRQTFREWWAEESEDA